MVGYLSSPHLVPEAQKVSGEPLVPIPWRKLETLALPSLKESAAAATATTTGQINSAARVRPIEKKAM